MFGGVREFLRTKGGAALAIAGCCVGALIVFWVIKSTFAQDSGEYAASHRIFMDASTHPPKSFKVDLQAGMSIPVKSPYSGKDTGYLAELCYWTKSGGVKEDPTPVLLNQHLGKSGPTFCPDCGRLVVGHNPAAIPGTKPPPTEEEYKSRGGRGPKIDPRDR